MCHFVTAVVPVKSDLARLSALMGEHQLAARPVENRLLAAQLRPGERLLLTAAAGGCDCGTELGRALRRVRRRARSQDRGDETGRWIACLAAVLASGAATRFGILLHDYRGATDDEPIALARRQPVPLAELTRDLLSRLEEDVLYEVRPN
ncbi:MAG TPA: hypothetical protein VFF06_23265 [Polyangia bacterium]|nr:hypothetical protein [Polyangia bacterium]